MSSTVAALPASCNRNQRSTVLCTAVPRQAFPPRGSGRPKPYLNHHFAEQLMNRFACEGERMPPSVSFFTATAGAGTASAVASFSRSMFRALASITVAILSWIARNCSTRYSAQNRALDGRGGGAIVGRGCGRSKVRPILVAPFLAVDDERVRHRPQVFAGELRHGVADGLCVFVRCVYGGNHGF